MGGGCHHICKGDWARVDTRRDQPRNVCHINQQVGPDFVCDLAEFRPVQYPAVGRKSTDNHFRLVCHGELPQRVVVDQTRAVVDTVLHCVIDLAREIHRGAMREVPAIGKAHA